MGRHTNPNQPTKEPTLEEILEFVQQEMPDAIIGPIMPGSEIMDDLESEQLNEDELKVIAAPVNRLGCYTAAHGDLELAKLAYGWIETSENPEQRSLRFSVFSSLNELDVAMAAAEWIEAAPTHEMRHRRYTILMAHTMHVGHGELTNEVAAAALWIED